VKCIRILRQVGRWAKVSYGLRQLVIVQRGYAPFTYRGLVKFLLVAEEVLDNLGEGPMARQEATHPTHNKYEKLNQQFQHKVWTG